MPRREPDSDDRLLVAAAGEPTAFAEFYRRYEQPMLIYFLRRTRDPELAADLTAEVFAAALGAARRFRPGRAPASAWLFGIAHHKLAKARRRGLVEDRARRRLGMAPIELDDEDLARIAELDDGEGAVLALLADLPADQREAITARVLADEPYGAIADRLRTSPAVVRKRVSRGLQRLREQLGQEPQ